MGKLVYAMNVSLDGFIEDAAGSLEWSHVDEEIHGWFNDHERGADALLYGRRLYETMAGYWPTAFEDPSATPWTLEFARTWNSRPKIVFSRSLTSVGPNCRLVSGDVGEVLAQLREEFRGELHVGGATLAGEFVRRGLVDEYRVVVHPVVLGAGKPFFPSLDVSIALRQTEFRRFASGVVLLSYVPEGR